MDKYCKKFDESDIVKNMLKDYIDKLIIYLEQDYELQDFIFHGFKIYYLLEQSVFNTKFVLMFPNDFIYEFAVNLNVDDLPYFNKIVKDIKFMLIK